MGARRAHAHRARRRRRRKNTPHTASAPIPSLPMASRLLDRASTLTRRPTGSSRGHRPVTPMACSVCAENCCVLWCGCPRAGGAARGQRAAQRSSAGVSAHVHLSSLNPNPAAATLSTNSGGGMLMYVKFLEIYTPLPPYSRPGHAAAHEHPNRTASLSRPPPHSRPAQHPGLVQVHPRPTAPPPASPALSFGKLPHPSRPASRTPGRLSPTACTHYAHRRQKEKERRAVVVVHGCPSLPLTCRCWPGCRRAAG